MNTGKSSKQIFPKCLFFEREDYLNALPQLSVQNEKAKYASSL